MFDLFKRKPADEPADARPWSERLKSGLSLSRERLAGSLAGVFSRRKLDDDALEAREQLAVWGERNNIAVIRQQSGDPAAVMFDALGAARARNIDVVLADTAGRLPTQAPLMDELAKVKRVLAKARAGAPDE